ncbi:beta-ketoacyl-[acyl-carrier-protein] synthase family protein [Acidobacteriota bacterium]
MDRKVVITGLNMMTAVGLDLNSSWENLVAGKSGIGKITLFDASEHQTQIAGELPEGFEEYSKKRCRKSSAKQMARGIKMCYVCAKEAVADSCIDFEKLDKSRCGVIMGVAGTGHSRIYQEKDPRYWILKTMDNALSAWVSLEYRLEGPNYTVATACASGGYAAANGYDLIRTNQADVVIVGGSSASVAPEEIKGFNELYALSLRNDAPEEASRPFSVDRDGFVIGEGAGTIILESEESARNRGAKIYAEMAGYALTSEGYNIMSPIKDGTGMAKTLALALLNAGINKEEVDYINAHGTSTTANDLAETLAIKKVFGDHAYKLAVSSTKSMIGHTISAAGAIEGIVTIMSIDKQVLTPTINYNPDPELDLDYVPNEAREQEVKVALSDSFAFGGHNATLVFRKYEG